MPHIVEKGVKGGSSKGLKGGSSKGSKRCKRM
jgi:hypothetical protein